MTLFYRRMLLLSAALLSFSLAAKPDTNWTTEKSRKMDAIPRQEYPRPQFVRETWSNLNGWWSCEFDFSNSGIERGLAKSKGFSRQILVPFCPESRLSGIGFRDFIPAMFYHRKLTIPKEWKDRRILLHFGGVDYECEGFINGRSVGKHFGGTVSFSFDITREAAAGKTVDFVLRVTDDLRSRTQASGKQSTAYGSSGCHYTRTTGIWQTVWMEPVAQNALKSCRVIPLLDEGAFSFQPEFYESSANHRLRVKVSIDGKTAEDTCITQDGASLKIHPPKIRPWSPDDPFLYDIEYTVTDSRGNVMDRVTSYAGLRKIHTANGKFYLNNKPIYLRLVLDQGFYPDGIWTAPSDEALRRDIELSKQAGFNGARLHQKVFEERFHYWADRLGYLTWGESASWGSSCFSGAPPSLEAFWKSAFRFLEEWKEIVKRDRNHPSIIAWTPANETGTNDRFYSRYRDIITAIYELTKDLDPTRPVNDCSGYIHVKPDLWTVHNYTGNGNALKQQLAPPNSPVMKLKPYEVPFDGQPYFITEYGGVRYLPPGQKPYAANSWGYNKQIKDPETYCNKIRELTDAILENPTLCGYCYTQLTNVEQEENGIYNYDRTPKVPVQKLFEIFSRNPKQYSK